MEVRRCTEPRAGIESYMTISLTDVRQSSTYVIGTCDKCTETSGSLFAELEPWKCIKSVIFSRSHRS